MNLSEPFIRRPVATSLLTAGVALAGAMAFFLLPVAPLPQVDFPTIQVQANMAGASPETMATSVATPLERHLGQIADVDEMTSTSTVGSTRITLQFGLTRDIDGAARDVQAAINAARADLPTSLKSNPTYKKANPADFPVMGFMLTSDTLTPGQLYDSAATVLQQKLSQVPGIGQVEVAGSSLPAVRAELNPTALFKYRIGLEDVRAALAAANANSPKGDIDVGSRRYQVYTNDQATHADQYRNLVVAYRNHSPVRLSDVAEVQDAVEDLRNQGLANGKPSVLINIRRQPGANVIEIVDRIKAMLPELRASVPSAIDMRVSVDRSVTIRTSLREVGRTQLIAVLLVIAVVFVFLRNGRATLIPSVAVPVSLVGTFGVMYLLGFSLNNLSLMGLTIATSFVVDDAIVVLENISRHMESGMPRMQAALLGAREVGFTVLSISLSLIAVFIPILAMGGIVGRLFREFAMTLSVAILLSLVVSLSATPMICSRWLRVRPRPAAAAVPRRRNFFTMLFDGYRRSLSWALDHGSVVAAMLLAVICLNVFLFIHIPKGFFPQQDTGRLQGRIQADQGISFQLMREKLKSYIAIITADPAVNTVTGSIGGGGNGGESTNTGMVSVALKPLKERKAGADQVIARLRPQLAKVPGATLVLQSVQDVRVGARMSNAQYQYTLQADELSELLTWAPRLTDALKNEPTLIDVTSDQQDKGLETDLLVDRASASRLGLTASAIDNTLYDAFGQRQVSTIYNALNQYHVVMEVAPPFWQNPAVLDDIYVSTSGGAVGGTQGTNAVAGTVVIPKSTNGAGGTSRVANDAARNLANNSLANSGKGAASTGAAVSTSGETMVPLSAFARFGPGTTPVAVNHQGHFAATTISFNLPEGKSLSDAVAAINRVSARIGVPISVHGSFAGTAKTFQESLRNEPLLIGAAIITVYIVLGILYESTIIPITILSTLPSAGVGAVLALLMFNMEFSVIGLIGVILLIGIVKKNAIMMIDFALAAERSEHLSPREAIYRACMLRFRPIMMTTTSAIFAAIPLAVGFGEGSELRRPLGISIVGGLLVSQVLTLYTTPVIYVYLDRFRLWSQRFLQRRPRPDPLPAAALGADA
ncbi:MAG: efflux RND transporter permease subunit [Nevskia sp.]|nr:efflux RND transporter permease subunit [Nevskia sp.]